MNMHEPPPDIYVLAALVKAYSIDQTAKPTMQNLKCGSGVGCVGVEVATSKRQAKP